MPDDRITVIIPTSPIPSHPSTAVIEETLRSIRYWFPNAIVYVLADGVRPEMEHRRDQYREYLERLLVMPGVDWCRVFHDHMHQAAMIKSVIPHVDTDLVMFSEHDLPLVMDRPIEWSNIIQAIRKGDVDCVRFMLVESINPEHEYLMVGKIHSCGIEMVMTRQWSGWTHIASTGFYRRLACRVPVRARAMLEPIAQGVMDIGPWEEWKLALYIPDPIAARRLYHLHGRGDDPKFEELFIYG